MQRNKLNKCIQRKKRAKFATHSFPLWIIWRAVKWQIMQRKKEQIKCIQRKKRAKFAPHSFPAKNIIFRATKWEIMQRKKEQEKGKPCSPFLANKVHHFESSKIKNFLNHFQKAHFLPFWITKKKKEGGNLTAPSHESGRGQRSQWSITSNIVNEIQP